MKKLNGKFILSALLVSAMVCSTAVTASAVVYPETSATVTAAPGPMYFPAPSATAAPATTEATEETTETPDEPSAEAEPTSVVTEASVEAALESDADVIEIEITPSASGKITMQEAAIAAIKESGKTVVLVDEKDGFKITIDPALIEEPKQLNLAMDINSSSKATTKDGVEIPANAIVIKPAQKGEFGLTLQLTFDLGDDLDPDNLYLFYITDDGEIEDYSDDLTVDGDEVTVSLSHASEYVITDEDITAEDENEVDDNTPIDDEPDIDIDVDDEPDATVDDEQEDTSKTETPSDTTGGLIIDGENTDGNPITGTSIVFGTLAVTALSAAAIAVTSKKRK